MEYKKILSSLENNFDSVIWQRGRDYYREGLIKNVVRTDDIITAKCQGNSLYKLKINLK
jgi:uncharacterized Zn finger protein